MPGDDAINQGVINEAREALAMADNWIKKQDGKCNGLLYRML
jgi:hypothetical protein